MGQTYSSTFTTILSYLWSGSSDLHEDLTPLIDLFNIRDGISALNAFRYDREATIEILRYFRQKRMLKEYKECIKGILKGFDTKDLSDLLRFCLHTRNYKDHLLLFGTPWEDVMIDVYCTILRTDELILNSGGEFRRCLQQSMAAKYAPTEKCHYDKRYDAVNKFCKVLGGGTKPWSKSKYRKFITKLRKSLDIVETKMSSGRWEEIDAKKVPFLARKRYKKAFRRHGVSSKVKFKRTELTKLGKIKKIKKLDPYTLGHKNVQYDITRSNCGFLFRLGSFFEEYIKNRKIENLIFIFGGDNIYERFAKDKEDTEDTQTVYWDPGRQKFVFGKSKIMFISDKSRRRHYIEGVDDMIIDYFLSNPLEISSANYINYITLR